MLVSLIFIVKCFNKQLTKQFVNSLESFQNKPGMYMYQRESYTGFLAVTQLQSSYFPE